MSKHEKTKVDTIVEALEGLKYGSVIVTIHEGVITQIDKTEKVRFPLQKHQPVK